MHWVIHPAYLWLEKNDKKRLPPVTTADRFMFDKGHQFEAVARKCFPDGKLVEGKPWEFAQLARQTKDFMEAGEKTIFQATAFSDRGLLVKSDVLVKNTESWDLYEIKSSTRVKDDHLLDLAFQVAAWEEIGIEIGRIYVYYVNRDYVRGETINPEQLVGKEEVTEQVREQVPKVLRLIPEALATMQQSKCPDLDPGLARNLGVWMPLYFHLHPDLASDHPYRLTQFKPDDLERLQQGEWGSLADIDHLSAFNARQQGQIHAWQTKKPQFQPAKIKQFLDSFEFPLWFLDYETISHAVPIYPGTSAYQDVPFQYSLHKLESPDGELEHYEYLATSEDFPVPKLVEKLQEHLDGPGTILVWYENFEKTMNSRMGEFCPEYADWLAEINGRIKDLMVPFARGWYVDKYFAGSASIKNVLPVLVPELSYKELGVQDGGSAQAVWYEAVFGGQASAKVFDELRKYCTLDTLAMVEIYRFLHRLVQDGSAPQAQALTQAQLF